MFGLITKKILPFIKNRQGVTSVEFAIISPLIIVLVFGLIELSYLSLAQAAINSLTRDIARINITSYAMADVQSRKDTITNLAMNSLAATFKTDTFVLDTQVISAFQNIPSLDPSKISTNYGGPSDIVVYRVSADHYFLIPGFAKLVGGDFSSGQNKVTLFAQLVVRNEP